jgi:hypothetical protein
MHDGRSPTSVKPPYLGYTTLQNFIFSLRQGVPQRIDRSLMPRFGGTVQKQLMQALRYLGLVTETGVTEPMLRQLVLAEGAERKQFLGTMLRSAYPRLLGDATDSFDLSTATPRQLEEQFRAFGLGGQTLRKAARFFVHAATDAGITISPHIHKTGVNQQEGSAQPPRPRNGQKSKRRRSAEETTSFQDHDSAHSSGAEELRSRLASQERLIQAFVAKLPEFNPEWQPQTQNQWFEALTRLMTLANGEQAVGHNESDNGRRPVSR